MTTSSTQLRPEKIGQHRGEDPARVAEVETWIAPALRDCGYLEGAG